MIDNENFEDNEYNFFDIPSKQSNQYKQILALTKNNEYDPNCYSEEQSKNQTLSNTKDLNFKKAEINSKASIEHLNTLKLIEEKYNTVIKEMTVEKELLKSKIDNLQKEHFNEINNLSYFKRRSNEFS